MIERALHRVEAGQHGHDDSLGLTVTFHLLDRLFAPIDGFVDERRAERHRGRVFGRRTPLLTGVTRAPRVLDGVSIGLGSVAEAARDAGGPGEAPAIARPASSPADSKIEIVALMSSSTISRAPSFAPVRGRTRRRTRLPEPRRPGDPPARSPPPARRMPRRTGPLGGAPRRALAGLAAAPGGGRAGAPRRGPRARRGGRRLGQGASSRRGEPPVPSSPIARPVRRAARGEIRPGLLEVVAEDLLELGSAVRVHLVRPCDEPLGRSARARLRMPS